jgi:uncharacterized protein
MTSDADQGAAASTSIGFVPGPAKRSTLEAIFLGPNGIRAGWRLLLFIAFFLAIAASISFVLRHIPPIYAWHHGHPRNEMTGSLLIFDEGFTLLPLLISAFLMSLIERRTFADYYLPPCEAFGKRFWQGIPYGLAMLSLLMGAIAAFHGFSIEGFAITAGAAVKYGLLYGIGFILVGLFEEFSFRGYMQSTLGSGIGFWPAAILLSIVFGAGHLSNIGEAWFGALMAGSFGLLAAFALSRTGNIWFPIGMHAGFDWGETYLYSVPDSGFVAQGHLLNSSFHGPTWITGGSVGPEGSAFVFVVLVLAAIGIHFIFPAKPNTIPTS